MPTPTRQPQGTSQPNRATMHPDTVSELYQRIPRRSCVHLEAPLCQLGLGIARPALREIPQVQ